MEEDNFMRTIFIGDIHGCAAEFQEMLDTVGFRKGTDRLLLTGDAFARGPDPLGVWTLIRDTAPEMVLGNHDDRLLDQLPCRLNGQPVTIKKPDHLFTLDSLMPAAKAVYAWLKHVPLYIENEAFLLVHAGINPEKGLEGTIRDEFLTIRTWPPARGNAGPRWYNAYTPDKNIVIFGHDALGGLVVRRGDDGTPYLIGLDSGCVYGGHLSAYILEEDRVVQVESRQRYY